MARFSRAAAFIAAAVTLLFSPFSLSCAVKDERVYFSRDYFCMGSIASLITPRLNGGSSPYAQEEQAAFNALSSELETILKSAENSLSATVENSYIGKFNRAAAGETTQIDEFTYNVLSLALDMYDFTGGYYNPAVYHSVTAYNFPQSVPPENFPTREELQSFTALCSHFPEIELSVSGGNYFAKKPDYSVTVGGKEYALAIDLGGIGKGKCADAAEELFEKYSLNYGYFDFGSSSMSLRKYIDGDGSYELMPCDPRDRSKAICSIRVSDCNLSTSGDYEHFYEVDGVRYCHIIDPFTGAPIRTGVCSVTVIGGSAAECDALTTALSCMDKLAAVDFINQKLTDRKVIMLIEEDGQFKIIANCEISEAAFPVISKVEEGRIVLNVA